jgi:hypothetical protein
VTPDGKLKLPLLPGMRLSEDVSVGGLGLGEAGQRVEQAYQMLPVVVLGKNPRVAGFDFVTGFDFQVVIERGTVDQLWR